jgi:hypothetical protein
LKRGGHFFRGAEEGADFEGLYVSRGSECTLQEAVMGVGAGGGRPSRLAGPGVLGPTPESFLICECPYVHLRVLKGHMLARKMY